MPRRVYYRRTPVTSSRYGCCSSSNKYGGWWPWSADEGDVAFNNYMRAAGAHKLRYPKLAARRLRYPSFISPRIMSFMKDQYHKMW